MVQMHRQVQGKDCHSSVVIMFWNVSIPSSLPLRTVVRRQSSYAGWSSANISTFGDQRQVSAYSAISTNSLPRMMANGNFPHVWRPKP